MSARDGALADGGSRRREDFDTQRWAAVFELTAEQGKCAERSRAQHGAAAWLALTRRFAAKVPGYLDGSGAPADIFAEIARQLAAAGAKK